MKPVVLTRCCRGNPSIDGLPQGGPMGRPYVAPGRDDRVGVERESALS
jgi:hypothetical protein